MGVISKEEQIYPYLGKLPFIGKYFYPPIITYEIKEKEELRELKAAIDARLEELKLKEADLKEKEEELKRREEELNAFEEDLYAREEAILQKIKAYEDEEKKWQKQVTYFSSMSPDAAAKILSAMKDEDVIEILRRMKEPIVAATFMKMAPERAAQIARKMTE
jgi:flagellar motility protein MotE (MotC chaperone)